MFRKTAGMMAAVWAAGWIFAGAAPAAVDKAALDKAIGELPKYDWGQSRAALNVIDDAIVKTHGDAAARKDIEKRLAAVLKADATRAAKQYVCRKLAVIGSAASVDALAPLLTDKDLSHMGRYALERIGAPEAGKALRDAVGKVQGKLKVGMVNSVGMRQDAQAVGSLVGLLKNSDAQVAAAAAAALGKIGDKGAAKPLADFLASAPKQLKNAAIDASLDFAQRIAKKGDKDGAAKIYQGLYAKGQPSRVRRAALQGLAMVRPTETAPLILEALSSTDAAFRGLAVNMIKEMPGADTTKRFADHLPKLPPAGQVAMLDALAARKDAAACPAVLKAAESANAEVKVAALKAAGAVAGAAQVPMLAKAAAGEGDTASAARASLAQLRGADVNKAILSALASGDAKVKVELIKALAARTATEAAPDVLKRAKDADANVRRAAIEALGSLGDEKELPALVAMLKATSDAGDRSSLDKAMTAICSRVREKAADCLVSGLEGANSDAKVVMLNALNRAGGAKALSTIVANTSSADAKVKDAAIRSLASWPDKAAMGPLMELVDKVDGKVFKILALRGIVNLARARDTSGKDRWQALSKAMAVAEGVKDNGSIKLVLGALRDVQTLDALKLVAKYVDVKGLSEEAGSAAARIAGNDRVWKKDKALAKETLEKVVKNTRNRRTKRDAQNALRKIK